MNTRLWAEIFAKQMMLAIKYKEIEGMGDLLETTDKNLDTKHGQMWIRDFAWRVTEELAEAYDAYYTYKSTQDEADKLAYKEEFADALHFLVELTIIAGYSHEIFIDKINPTVIPGNPWDTVYHLGMMCNTLKNKSWKKSEVETDRAKFESQLIATWITFLNLLQKKFHSLDEVGDFYFKKNKVNQKRQESNY